MTLLQFNPAEVPAAISTILDFVKENPILSGVLFFSYALFYLYTFINNTAVDSEVYEIDLLSSGISSAMVALLLVGLDETSKGFSLTNIDMNLQTTKIAVFLFIFAMVLIIFAFVRILPKFFVVLLGNNEVDLFINLVAVLMTDPEIVITGTLLGIIIIPLAVLFVIQRIRRFLG